MVAGTLRHLRALRRMESDNGWIQTLLNEAENERMHLMTFVEIAKPSRFERFLILMAQGIFYNFYFIVYLCSLLSANCPPYCRILRGRSCFQLYGVPR